jgi:hypothetical protein
MGIGRGRSVKPNDPRAKPAGFRVFSARVLANAATAETIDR